LRILCSEKRIYLDYNATTPLAPVTHLNTFEKIYKLNFQFYVAIILKIGSS
jgi:hypothetical protein